MTGLGSISTSADKVLALVRTTRSSTQRSLRGYDTPMQRAGENGAVSVCLPRVGCQVPTHPKEDTEDQKGGQSFTKEDKKDVSLTLNSQFGVRSSSSNQTKLANCKLRNMTEPGKSRENQLLQCS